MKQHIYEWVVKETYTDLYGHINNASYIQIFEEARWDLVNEKGVGSDYMKKTGLGPIILEIKTKFKKEVTPREKIKITTEIISFKNKIGHIKQLLYKEGGELATEAKFTFAIWNFKTRKIVEPPKEWLVLL